MTNAVLADALHQTGVHPERRELDLWITEVLRPRRHVMIRRIVNSARPALSFTQVPAVRVSDLLTADECRGFNHQA